MNSPLTNLTPEIADALQQLCEEHPYIEAGRLAREQLGLQSSPSALCRWFTRHKIAEDQQTRADYAASAGIDPTQLLSLAESQLQLRLLELASRPNPGASELRALFQIITRLQSLALSQRRVVIAEQREARMKQGAHQNAISAAQPAEPAPAPVTQRQLVAMTRKALGRDYDPADIPPEPPKNPKHKPTVPSEEELARITRVLLGSYDDKIVSDRSR
jgi:hypothetical protein